MHRVSFIILLFLCVGSAHALLIADTFTSGDIVVLDETAYTVLVDPSDLQVLLQSNVTGSFFTQNVCKEFLSYDVCVSNITSNYTAYMEIYELIPSFSFNRSEDSITPIVGNATPYTLEISNNGTVRGQIYFEEEFPNGTVVDAFVPCTTSGQTVYLDASVAVNESVTCTVELTFLTNVDATVSGTLLSQGKTWSAPAFAIDVRDPMSLDLSANRTFLELDNGPNSTFIYFNYSNLISDDLDVYVWFELDPFPELGSQHGYTVDGNVLTKTFILEGGQERVDDFYLTYSSPADLTITPYVAYTYEDFTSVLPVAPLEVLFNDSDVINRCTGEFEYIGFSDAFGIIWNSTNGTVLEVDQGTSLYIDINNTVIDADFTDTVYDLFVDGELYDRVSIPYIPACSHLYSPDWFIPPRFTENETVVVYSINGTTYIDAIRYNFTSTFDIRFPQSRSMAIESVMVDQVQPGTTVTRSVSVTSALTGDVYAHVFDVSSHPFSVIGVSDRWLYLEDTTNDDVLSYTFDIPLDMPVGNITFNSTVRYETDNGWYESSIEDILEIIDVYYPANITTALDTARRGDLTMVDFTVFNDGDAPIENAFVVIGFQEGIDSSERIIDLGTLAKNNQRTFTVPIRFVHYNDSLAFDNVALYYDVRNLSYAEFLKSDNITLTNVNSPLGLGFSANLTYIDSERLYYVNFTIENFDNQARDVTLPFLDAVDLSYDETVVQIEAGKKFSMTFKTPYYNEFMLSSVRYSFLGVDLYTGTLLPSLQTLETVEEIIAPEEEIVEEVPQPPAVPPRPAPHRVGSFDVEDPNYFLVFGVAALIGLIGGICFFLVVRKRK